MTERADRFLRLWGPIALSVLGFAVLWGATQARLAAAERLVDSKADAAVVTVQNEAVLRELADIKIMLRDHLAARR